MFGKKQAVLNGNWEERGVIGTRIEIEGNHLTVLWQGAPVLETVFQTETAENGAVVLLPKKRGLRYQTADSDYASVVSLRYEEDRLHFIKDFPITGPSEEVLEKTENSRYGHYTVEDKKMLPILQGDWADENGYFKLRFSKDTLTVQDRKIKIHVLKSKSDSPTQSRYLIADADPSRHEIPPFFSIELEGGVLTGRIMIFDAPAETVILKKQ